MGWQAPRPTSPASPRARAIRTFVLLYIAVVLLAAGASMVGLAPQRIGWIVGLPIALVGAVLSYRGIIR